MYTLFLSSRPPSWFSVVRLRPSLFFSPSPRPWPSSSPTTRYSWKIPAIKYRACVVLSSPRRIVAMPFYSSECHLNALHLETTIWFFPDLDQDFHSSDQFVDQYLELLQEPAPFQSPVQDWDIFSCTDRSLLLSIMGPLSKESYCALPKTYLKTNRVPNFYSIDTNPTKTQRKQKSQAKM